MEICTPDVTDESLQVHTSKMKRIIDVFHLYQWIIMCPSKRSSPKNISFNVSHDIAS